MENIIKIEYKFSIQGVIVETDTFEVSHETTGVFAFKPNIYTRSKLMKKDFQVIKTNFEDFTGTSYSVWVYESQVKEYFEKLRKKASEFLELVMLSFYNLVETAKNANLELPKNLVIDLETKDDLLRKSGLVLPDEYHVNQMFGS